MLRTAAAWAIRRFLPFVLAAIVGGATARYLPSPAATAVNAATDAVAPVAADALACKVNPADPACRRP